MRIDFPWSVGVLVLLLFISSGNALSQCPTGTNLILNPDAEADQGLSGDVDHNVVEWIDTPSGFFGQFTVIPYGTNGGFPTAGSPGPPDRGNYFFSGGPASADSFAYQEYDIPSDCFALIDAGMIRFSNSGWFGGKGGQADRAELRAEFFNANSNVIGTSDVGAITAIDRNNTTGLIFKTTGDELPPTTRRIKFTLFMTQSSGPNDGYADNLNFSMSTVTAASVTISGRVVNSDGGAVRGAIVSLTGSDGLSRTSRTNAFGYFRFQEIEAGQSVLLNVRAKGKIFEPNSTLLNIQDEISGLEFRSVN